MPTIVVGALFAPYCQVDEFYDNPAQIHRLGKRVPSPAHNFTEDTRSLISCTYPMRLSPGAATVWAFPGLWGLLHLNRRNKNNG